MAKRKINLDKDAVNKFFISHGEKLVFGLAIAVIAFFVWRGLKTPSYSTTTPAKLYQTAAEDAQRYLDKSDSWDKIAEYRECDPYPAERIRKNMGLLNPNNYIYGCLCGTINSTLGLREDPQMIPISNLETEFIRTQIATQVDMESKSVQRKLMMDLNGLDSDTGSLGKIKYESFAYRPQVAGLTQNSHTALTYDVVAGIALVPFGEQVESYRETFSGAIGWHKLRDTPQYKYLEVQRSDDGGETWFDINEKIAEFRQFFASDPPEVIDEEFIVEGVTNPIPPFLSVDYREFAGHSATTFAKLLDEDFTMTSTNEDDDDGPLDDMFNQKNDSDKKMKDMKVTSEEEDAKSLYRLARFYDPTPKEVGKTYQYRVRLWVVDPNTKNFIAAAGEKGGSGSELKMGGGSGNEGAASIQDGESNRSGGGGEDEVDKEDAFWIENPPVEIVETMLHEDVRRRQKTAKYELPPGVNEASFADRVPTDWSNVSVVTIPENYARFYTDAVVAPNIYTAADGTKFTNEENEPKANIVALTQAPSLDVSIPVNAESVFRGSVLNLNANARFLHPITWAVKTLNEFSNKDVDDDDRRRKDPKGLFYQTDAIVLDFIGGHRMPFSKSEDPFTMPSEIILMDSSGRLIVRNEMEDATNYRISTLSEDDEEPDAERLRREAERESGRQDRNRGGDDNGLGGPG